MYSMRAYPAVMEVDVDAAKRLPVFNSNFDDEVTLSGSADGTTLSGG